MNSWDLADSAPQALGADGVFTVLSRLADTVRKILHGGAVFPLLLNEAPDAFAKRDQPGKNHQADQHK